MSSSSSAPKRVAISFNTSSSKPAPRPTAAAPSTTTILGRRPRAGGFDDSDSEGADADAGKQEKITGFGADGAETGSSSKTRGEEQKKDYVIAKQPNRDWRAEKRRQTSGLPGREQQQQNSAAQADREEADQDTGIKWGLTVKPKIKTEDNDENDANTEPAAPRETTVKKEEDPNDPDKEAMSALLGYDTQGRRPADIIPPSESDAYKRDIHTAGEASTLADYEAMPVEEFGAALLRGMGWDGEEQGRMRYRDVRRRPARLGLGAKELKGEEELGGWKQGGDGKKKTRPRLDEYKREKERERERREARRADRDRGEDRRRDDERRRDRYRDERDRRR